MLLFGLPLALSSIDVFPKSVVLLLHDSHSLTSPSPTVTTPPAFPLQATP